MDSHQPQSMVLLCHQREHPMRREQDYLSKRGVQRYQCAWCWRMGWLSRRLLRRVPREMTKDAWCSIQGKEHLRVLGVLVSRLILSFYRPKLRANPEVRLDGMEHSSRYSQVLWQWRRHPTLYTRNRRELKMEETGG